MAKLETNIITPKRNTGLDADIIEDLEIMAQSIQEELNKKVDSDDIPELENDSGFLKNKGTVNDWVEFDNISLKDGETFIFKLSGIFSSNMGICIGYYSDFKLSSGYIYRYIDCYNITTQKSLKLDILNQKLTANQMPIQDANNYFTSNGLDDVLQEIGRQLDGVEELLGGI